MADKVGPAAVRLGGGWRGGSGVVIGQGAVLTNAHNVRSEEVSVTFADGRTEIGTVAGVDVDGDLAVISVDTGSASAIEWAGTSSNIGTVVLAVTVNGSGPRVTLGFVSSVARAFRGPRGRRISGSLEHTAPLVPGSSGSALVDSSGKLLGINTNRLGGGFYLALPADEALRTRVAALQRGESAERPRLGIGIAPSWVANRMRRAVGLPDREGVLVREVEEGSPAATTGLREGDLLVEANGRPIREPDDVFDALGAVNGGRMSLRIVRGAEEMTVDATFDASASAPDSADSESAVSEGSPVH
ncbi:MAG: trypsin-like peptidase domain-containing protein [Candidatus Limnocylindrales bacterium]